MFKFLSNIFDSESKKSDENDFDEGMLSTAIMRSMMDNSSWVYLHCKYSQTIDWLISNHWIKIGQFYIYPHMTNNRYKVLQIDIDKNGFEILKAELWTEIDLELLQIEEKDSLPSNNYKNKLIHNLTPDEIIDINLKIEKITQVVNSKIKSYDIAKQFVFEELNAASYGNDIAQEFTLQSGISEEEYKNPLSNSYEVVEDIDDYISNSTIEYLDAIDKMILIRTTVVSNIMEQWKIGKYK